MFRGVFKSIGQIVNMLVLFLGFAVVTVGVSFTSNNTQTIMISIGCSLIATSIVSILTTYYLVNTNKVREIIEFWGLENIYPSKGEMNPFANEHLNKARNCIDVMAIGMSNYITNAGTVLENKIKNGVAIRIISCNPSSDMLKYREIDESIAGGGEPTGAMRISIHGLIKWVKKMKIKYPESKIEIKFHNTYPAFNYLKIDGIYFWSPNLFLKTSQQCIAWSFRSPGKGYNYFDEHFNCLWNDDDFLWSVERVSETELKAANKYDFGG